MAARDIRAGGAFVEFTLRKNALTKGLRAVSSELNRFGKQATAIGSKLAGLGAAITAPFALALRQFIKVGDALDKMAARTGVSVEALSSLGFAAEQTGANAETLEKGVRGMQRAINDLGRGLSTQNDAFGELGITFEQIENLSPEDQFKLIANEIAKVENPSKRAALSMQIFGRAGSQLLPLLSQGAKGIEAFQAEAEALGIDIDTETASAAAELGDRFNILKRQIGAAAVAVGASLAPVLTRVSQLFATVGSSIIEFVKNNRALILTIASIGVGITALGSGLIALGVASIGTAASLSAVATAVGVILSPLGLIVTAATAAGIAIFKFTDLGGQAVAFLQERFGGLGKFITDTFGAIGDAIAGGDIRLAAEILWTSLKLIFVQGTSGLLRELIEFRAGALGAWEEVKSGVLAIANNLRASLQKIWVSITTGAKGQFSSLTADVQSAFNLIQLGASKAANAVRGALDDGFDSSAANREAEEQFAARQRGLESRDRENQERINQQRQDGLQAIEADRAANEEKITKAMVDGLAKVNRQEADATEGLASTLSELQNKRAELLGRIAELPQVQGGGRFDPVDADIEAGLSAASVRREVTRGVLNSGAIQALSSVGTIGKGDKAIVDAVKDQTRETRRTNDILQSDGGVVFA